MKGWHFLPDDGRLRWGLKSQEVTRGKKVRVGETIRIKGPLVLCERGLHGSERIIDALGYAPGALVCCCEYTGDILRGTDKFCATERIVIWMADATNTLHEFACWCAEESLTKAHVTDERSWTAIRIKRAWLAGEATDVELCAARNAAWAAAADAARDAARAAAGTAAGTAARAAARAAWAAYAARDVARDAQNTKLTEMVEALNPYISPPNYAKSGVMT
jgi:hypothetical protein